MCASKRHIMRKMWPSDQKDLASLMLKVGKHRARKDVCKLNQNSTGYKSQIQFSEKGFNMHSILMDPVSKVHVWKIISTQEIRVQP